MASRRGRLEISGNQVDEMINPNLKKLLSFKGAEDLVGELADNSIEELMHNACDALKKGQKVSSMKLKEH